MSENFYLLLNRCLQESRFRAFEFKEVLVECLIITNKTHVSFHFNHKNFKTYGIHSETKVTESKHQAKVPKKFFLIHNRGEYWTKVSSKLNASLHKYLVTHFE